MARHPFLAEHFARFFRDAGVDVTPAVGLDDANAQLSRSSPDVVICDYDLLTAATLREMPVYAALRRMPLVATSMTRVASEMSLVAGGLPVAYWYLPTLRPDVALHQVYAAVASHAREAARDAARASRPLSPDLTADSR